MAEQQPSGPSRRWIWWVSACLAVLICLSPVGSHAAQERRADTLFPLPESLKPNVDFWIHVFARLASDTGLLHDTEDLSIIYQTLYNLPRDKARRRSLIKRKRNYYKGILERLARGRRQALTRDERRVLSMFRGKQTAAAFRKAAQRVRFQGGIREAFRAGLVRSGAYLPVIEPIFERAGLPKELTLIPHVESSFRKDAYSKSGAAGIWQFMPATGRRFLTISRTVDERLDVYLATIAATKLLKDNYRLLGTWPLAVTAYNHGAWGMKRAVAKVGTKNIGTIVQHYRGRSFGFASRNFYAEFLAAVHVTKHYKTYFGAIRFDKPLMDPFQQHYRVQRGDSLARIAQRFGTTVGALVAMNDMDQPNLIKTGQVLQVPAEQTVASGSVAYRPTQPSKRQRYQVQKGDTLGAIAVRFDTAVATLAMANGLSRPYIIKPGQVLDVAQSMPLRRYQVKQGDTLGGVAARFNTTVTTLAMANGLSRPYIIKPGQVLDVAQSMPLRRYQVKQGDTLGRVAKRFRTTVATLAALNGLRKPYLIKTGQTLVIPQLRSRNLDDSTVIGMRLPGEDMRTGLRAAAA